jgi:pseudaminic acid biosynthesis-associated methylase
MILTAGQETNQIREWTGSFGKHYTDRNAFEPIELDSLYESNYGITRRDLNQRFLQGIPRSARILEVGCNVGNQLLALQDMGFRNLFGIEIQSYALERAKSRVLDAGLVQASALAIPYPDQDFDLVFTSGVLIHIAPQDLPSALEEIHRCARSWIWGLEYYAPQMTDLSYRGHNRLLWKANYAQLYLQRFPSLELVREEHLRYSQNENVDTMFLLRRKAVSLYDKGDA